MNYIVITNKKAGKGYTKKNINTIIKYLDKYIINYKIVYTKRTGDAKNITEDAINNSFTNIIAVGGDGTINEIVNGIISSGKSDIITLGIIPTGGGNDLYRNFSLNKSIKHAIQTIKNNQTKKIDVCKIENQYFINSFGIGFDASVADKANKITYANGMFRYILAILHTLINLKSYKFKIESDNANYNSEYLLASVGNGKFVGGGIKMNPDADLQSNDISVCLVDKMSKLRVINFLPSAIKGTHIKSPKITTLKTKTLKITTEEILPIYIDGEIIVLKNPKEFTINISSKKININV